MLNTRRAPRLCSFVFTRKIPKCRNQRLLNISERRRHLYRSRYSDIKWLKRWWFTRTWLDRRSRQKTWKTHSESVYAEYCCNTAARICMYVCKIGPHNPSRVIALTHMYKYIWMITGLMHHRDSLEWWVPPIASSSRKCCPYLLFYERFWTGYMCKRPAFRQPLTWAVKAKHSIRNRF